MPLLRVMRVMQTRNLLSAAIFCAAAALAWQPAEKPAAPRWRMQYLYDEAKTALAIHDIQAITPKRVMAVGSVMEGRGTKAVSLTTQDGGEHWQLSPLEEQPVS